MKLKFHGRGLSRFHQDCLFIFNRVPCFSRCYDLDFHILRKAIDKFDAFFGGIELLFDAIQKDARPFGKVDFEISLLIGRRSFLKRVD